MRLFGHLKKKKPLHALEYLKNETKKTVRLSELVDAFERMCGIPVQSADGENEMLLFETGTFSFSGQSMFYFSLVRQWPNGEEEYCQLHLDIQYPPNDKNQLFSDAVWSEDMDTSFFDFVRGSDAYLSLKNDVIAQVDIFQDET